VAELIETPLTVLHAISCIFLILVVLLQPGKSGGLGAISGAAAQQVFGGRGAGNFLTKTTWATAGVFLLTSLTLARLSSSADANLAKKSTELTKKTANSAQIDPRGRGHLPPVASTNKK
jgi:preprotein translocase subunit SecG